MEYVLQENISVALYFTVLFLVYILCTYCSNYNNYVLTLNLTLPHVVTLYYQCFLKYTVSTCTVK